ncbi:MAG TPA: outer membrane protein transport protein, partial [Burkholderiales bacterium]|nr:outer membrane protein transport protein [Burkholderiales bacterium]
LQDSQFAAAGHFIKPSTKFNKTSATLAAGLGGATISGGDGGDAGEDAIVPNAYYSQQLNDKLVFGFGVNVPFGLATDYEDRWVGRYHADRSEIQTVNFNLGLGYRINNQFSIGGGINYQKVDATLSQAVDFASVCNALGASAQCGGVAGFNQANPNDGKAEIIANDDAWGFNIGFLWQVSDATRFGTAYRSKMKYELGGSADFTVPSNVTAGVIAGGGFSNTNVSADVTLPATWSISGFHQLTPQWAIMADVTRTFWSKLPELNIDFANAQPNSIITLGLKDVNRYSVGFNFTPGGDWSYRAGVAFDETPTPSAEERTPRLPDQDRLWLALGAKYNVNQKLNVDFGFVHIMVDDADINKVAGASGTENFFRGNLVGTYDADVNILSVQGTWSF